MSKYVGMTRFTGKNIHKFIFINEKKKILVYLFNIIFTNITPSLILWVSIYSKIKHLQQFSHASCHKQKQNKKNTNIDYIHWMIWLERRYSVIVVYNYGILVIRHSSFYFAWFFLVFHNFYFVLGLIGWVVFYTLVFI